VSDHSDWTVTSLHGDVTSLILAVTWKCSALTNQKDNYIGCIQLYYRENYYWYLKQQLYEEGLNFLAFDPENSSRFFVKQASALLRTVMIHWTVHSSHLRDGSVFMMDGPELQCTPLGYHSVPPPMSMYQEPLVSFDNSLVSPATCPRSISCWEVEQNEELAWGMAVLVNSKGDFLLGMGNARGKMMKKSLKLSLEELFLQKNQNSSLKEMVFREIVAVSSGNSNKISLFFIGTSFIHQKITFPAEENQIYNSTTAHNEQESMHEVMFQLDLTFSTTEENKVALSDHHILVIDEIPGTIRHVSRMIYSNQTTNTTDTDGVDEEKEQEMNGNPLRELVIGLSNHQSGDFEVIQFFSSPSSSDDVESYSNLSPTVITTIPEICYAFTVVKHSASSPEKPQITSSADDNHSYSSPGHHNDATQADSSCVVIALSHKNHLYCNEILLLTNVSSFYYSPSYHLMMCITLGNKPFLHFIMLQSLVHLLQLSYDMETNQEKLITLEVCEPRPLERGSRLILSVENDSKVILQMPRGNLEIIEPRIMILLQVQNLLLGHLTSPTTPDCPLMDCFLLLRKQKIDFNYLFDFQPRIFFQYLEPFINYCLDLKAKSTALTAGSGGQQHQNNFAEFLSLLITSIESQDVTKTKYSLFNTSLQLNSEELDREKQSFVDENEFINEKKVNFLCERIREILLKKLKQYQEEQMKQQREGGKPLPQPMHIIHPLLCTYAKQKPPLLQEALTLIKETCLNKNDLDSFSFFPTKNNSSNNNKSSNENRFYTNHLLMSCIKYLSFLCDGEKLFNTSLSHCDFLMTKLIARQCSMDPKVYLPLIEKFEKIGKNYPIDSSNYYLMNYKIQIHLNNAMKTIDFYLSLLERLFQEEKEHTNNDLLSENEKENLQNILSQVQNELTSEVLDIITKESQHYSILTKSLHLEKDILLNSSFLSNSSISSSSSFQLIQSFMNKLKLSYASVCYTEMNYSMAIYYYVSMNPPMVQKAVDAALARSDWKGALMIAGRYSSSSSSTIQVTAPKKLAQEIVYNFQQNQEYFSFHSSDPPSSSSSALSSPFSNDFNHVGDYFSSKYLSTDNNSNNKWNNNRSAITSALPLTLSTTTAPKKANNSSAAQEHSDKSLLAAKIAIEYCEDTETAVNILTTAYHWKDAMDIAIQYQRMDLLEEVNNF
jgi:hypothetical protein